MLGKVDGRSELSLIQSLVLESRLIDKRHESAHPWLSSAGRMSIWSTKLRAIVSTVNPKPLLVTRLNGGSCSGWRRYTLRPLPPSCLFLKVIPTQYKPRTATSIISLVAQPKKHANHGDDTREPLSARRNRVKHAHNLDNLLQSLRESSR